MSKGSAEKPVKRKILLKRPQHKNYCYKLRLRAIKQTDRKILWSDGKTIKRKMIIIINYFQEQTMHLPGHQRLEKPV